MTTPIRMTTTTRMTIRRRISSETRRRTSRRSYPGLSDFDFSSEDLSRSKEDEKVNYKKKEDDFTGLCLMTKERSSWNNSNSNSDSDSDVMDRGL
jgi:hypothetical protein